MKPREFELCIREGIRYHFVLHVRLGGTVQASETLGNFHQSTWRYKLDYGHARTHRREKLKSYIHVSLLVGELKNETAIK